MALGPRNHGPRRLRSLPVLTGVLALGLALGLQAPGVGAPPSPGLAPATASLPGDMPDEPTDVRISTFNLLGADHTGPNSRRRWRADDGSRHRYASGRERIHGAVQLLRDNHVDVVGMQEMRPSQYDEFTQVADDYDIYPGADSGRVLQSNAIAWRSSEWELVEAHTMQVYYFDNELPMPYVLLRNRTTGRLAWFYNSHNPADTRGNAQWRRDADVQREIDLVQQLRSEYPDVPVFITGDKNDRQQYFCPMVQGSEMQAANGGTASGSDCQMPSGPVPVDWIMGSGNVRFSGYQALDSALVRRTTDHRFVFSDAFIPSLDSAQSGIDHVVLITVNGLRPSAIWETGDQGTPVLHRMIAEGASTLNARTDYHAVNRLANAVSMLTAREAKPATGGHGAGWHKRDGSTLTQTAGHYVSSLMDVTHDFGRSTALFTTDRDMRLVRRSYNGHNGAADVFQPDNGRRKISQFTLAPDNRTVVAKTIARMRHSVPAFSFVQLDWAATQGERHGWHSKKYHRAVELTDSRIGQILDTLDSRPAGRHTVVIVTAERGGSLRRGNPAHQFDVYRVPVIATGPGVAAGADLYDLNPQLAYPHRDRASYAGAQPVRTAYLANLVTRLLGEPPVPGGTMDPGQELSIFPLPTTTE